MVQWCIMEECQWHRKCFMCHMQDLPDWREVQMTCVSDKDGPGLMICSLWCGLLVGMCWASRYLTEDCACLLVKVG